MLSYAEHGKFPATTQGRSPRERDEKVRSAPIRRGFLPWSASPSGSWEYDKRNGRRDGATKIPAPSPGAIALDGMTDNPG
jgi:hypothetical protein